jgi:hypothetical protein
MANSTMCVFFRVTGTLGGLNAALIDRLTDHCDTTLHRDVRDQSVYFFQLQGGDTNCEARAMEIVMALNEVACIDEAWYGVSSAIAQSSQSSSAVA